MEIWCGPENHLHKDRSTGYWDHRGHWLEGGAKVRDRYYPQGLPKLKQHLNVSTQAKRAARGFAEAKRRGRFASLEHPYNSYLWDLPEIRSLSTEKAGAGQCFQHAAAEAIASVGGGAPQLGLIACCSSQAGV